MSSTLFDKVWDAHIVKQMVDGPDVLYIDRHYIHEVTSPQAFAGLEKRGLKVLRPERVVATADHNVPTIDQHLPIRNELSRIQVETLITNCKKNGITLYGLNHPYQGIVHVIGPELGFTLPGMTIVCGDSHTSTHGAFGCVAFGIGTSEVEMVLASQCIMQPKPKSMRIIINNRLGKGVTAKDLVLYIISKLSAGGGTGHFVEFAGEAIRALSMEERMTICNMSIEMGARGGMIAPDEKTFNYVKSREYAPKGPDFAASVEKWEQLKSDDDASFDLEFVFDAHDIAPMITYGTNPGMGIKVTSTIPTETEVLENDRNGLGKSLAYMNFERGKPIAGTQVNYVFVGSCTNGRIEDIREFTSFVKGKKKADNITAWIVPGSKQVEKQAEEEGLVQLLKESGFALRQPGCSACLAMNEDIIPTGEYCVSTSNRNFEGRQGPGARTLLASPLTAAATAITGRITDPREFL
jgi:3-isopropylmalate/(R)-2-methylmalate dehydratase large subunit